MNMLPTTDLFAAALTALMMSTISTPVLAVDAEAAQALAKQKKCFKCHAINKKNEAIAWKEVAAKYKGKPDAEAKSTKHVTTGPKDKLDDGSEEEHPMVKTKKSDEIKNLVNYILGL